MGRAKVGGGGAAAPFSAPPNIPKTLPLPPPPRSPTPTAPGTKKPMPDTHGAAAVPSRGGALPPLASGRGRPGPGAPPPQSRQSRPGQGLCLCTLHVLDHLLQGPTRAGGTTTSNGRLALASASQWHACFRAGHRRTSVVRLPKWPGTLGPRAPCVPPGTGLHSQESHSRGLMGSQRTVPLDGSIAPEMPTGPSPRAAPSARRQKKKGRGQALSTLPPTWRLPCLSHWQPGGWGGPHSMEPRPLWLPSACFRDQNARARLSDVHRGSRQWP